MPNFKKNLSHKNGGQFEFSIFSQNIKMLISRKHRVSLQSSHANFQKNFVSQKMAAILNFRIFRKNCKT